MFDLVVELQELRLKCNHTILLTFHHLYSDCASFNYLKNLYTLLFTIPSLIRSSIMNYHTGISQISTHKFPGSNPERYGRHKWIFS